jgi:hypothetical protein
MIINNYLRVERERVVGNFGFGLRADLRSAAQGQDHALVYDIRPSALGLGLLTFGLLTFLLFVNTSSAERHNWPVYQSLGDFTVLVPVMAMAVGAYLIYAKRKRNKKVPRYSIIIKGSPGEMINVLHTADKVWATELAEKLRHLSDPATGDWEIFSLQRRIQQI